MQKIVPFLWFDDNLEEAVHFYTSIFKNASITDVRRMGGKVFTATFQIGGREFYALNGGPLFTFTPAISFFVNCETQQDIDELWKNLSDGGMVFMPLNKYPFSEKFGWVQDKFGVSWQLNLTGTQQKVSPFLLFVKDQHGKAEEAIKFYMSLFKNSEILKMERFGPGETGAEGTIKHAVFSLEGQEFMAMDSNMDHNFTFSLATSFFVNCNTQEEVDYFWEQFLVGGEESKCGWLKDKYGVSWQIIPTTLGKLLGDPDPVKSQKVMQAMLKMSKIIVKDLEQAYNQ